MPRPFGRDRLAGVKDGKLLLLCEESKGWRARSDATATSAEHPGTCVRWEDELFEVEDLEPRADGSVTYALRPWDERHTIRDIATYSLETEAARSAERRDARHRVEGHRRILLLAPLFGCLPAQIQEWLEKEYNVKALWMSLASAITLLLFGAAIFLVAARAIVFGIPGPLGVFGLILGPYLFFESAVRIAITSLQGRGIGTVAGTLLYEVWRLTRRGVDRAQGRQVDPEKSFFEVEPADPGEEEFDRFHLLEPALSFLELGEQASLAKRFGFDGLKWGRVSAVFLLIVLGPFATIALLRFLLVPQVSDLLVLAPAWGLSIEQILRLRKVAEKKLAPSILGVLVRPAARRLLDRTPLE